MTNGFEIGQGFSGEGPEAAHLNTLLGLRSGPLGTSFATALASPTTGHIPFLVVWAPNVPVTPATLFINKAAIASDRHGELTWGAAQAGVALGVTRYANERFSEPGAADEQLVFRNNAEATFHALIRGAEAPQSTAAIDALRSGALPKNPYLGT